MLETQRLILRKWTEEDAESLFEYAKMCIRDRLRGNEKKTLDVY